MDTLRAPASLLANNFTQMVMGSIPISSLPMGNRIMRDPLTSPHNTIMKETLSSANSRHRTNKALGSTRR